MLKLPSYPRAFWVLLALYFFNRIASSFIWPFISLFATAQTGEPLAHITPLLSLQAVTTLAGTSVVSTLMDRFGRKRAMLTGMLAYSAVLVAMSQATQLWQWAVMIVLYGITQPVFHVGTNAMVADLIEPERRTDAYALVRTVANVTIALGPALAGQMVIHSRLYSYLGAAALNLLLFVPALIFLQESLTTRTAMGENGVRTGFGVMLRDTRFITFCAVFGVLEIGIALVFSLLGVYVKDNFGILENEYGLLMTVNALMVVFFQYSVTRMTKRFPPYLVLAVGSLFYTGGLLLYGMASLLPHFALGMAILTFGELMVSPTATAQVANMAPAHMRARYMGIYSLLYTVGQGVGPLLGGLLSGFAPSAIWYGGAVATVIAAVGFYLMPRMWQAQRKADEAVVVEV
jgi:MFS family permease